MPSEWSKAAHSEPQSPTRRRSDDAIRRVAGSQKQVIAANQMADLGLSPRGQRSRAASGRLHRLHRGVFCLHPPPHSIEQLRLAAIYASGPDTLLAGWSALGQLAVTERVVRPIEVVNCTGRGRSLSGVRVHRAEVEPHDRAGRNGIPCTSVTRAIVDVARNVSEDDLEDLLLAADSKRILDRNRLAELLEERFRQPGTATLRALITDDPVEARSRNEIRLFKICRRFGVSLPVVGHRIEVEGRTFFADFCWPELKLIVEAGSWRWHGGRTAYESDADRDQLLSIAGWRIVYFTRDGIKHRPAETGQRLQMLTGVLLAGTRVV